MVYDADLPVTFAVANPGTIAGDNNDNILTGTAGNDILQGFGGNDTLIGLNGVDRAVYTDATGGITVDLAAGTVTGQGVGTDTLESSRRSRAAILPTIILRQASPDRPECPACPMASTAFEGMAGDDIITGNINVQGQALTRISYVSASAAVVVDLAAGTAIGNASVGKDNFTNVSTVIGSGYSDTLRGSDNEDGSFEQFDGRAGNDTIEGRGGYDFAAYNNDPATHSGITVNLAAGTVTGDASVGSDTLRNVEGVRGTHFDDTYNAVGFNGGSTNAGSLAPSTISTARAATTASPATATRGSSIRRRRRPCSSISPVPAAGGTGLARDKADAIN